MKKQELVNGLKYLSIVYNKDFDENLAAIWYDNLSDQSYENFIGAIKKIVKTSKFMPTISEVIDECGKNKNQKYYEILKKMKENGYFKSEFEYEKMIKWFNEDIIPSWFIKEIDNYKLLTNTTVKQLGCENI